jgi:hypothetical protein
MYTVYGGILLLLLFLFLFLSSSSSSSSSLGAETLIELWPAQQFSSVLL